ncbi:hypothetical protein Nepgr_011455 [Nepenthes gracilis]|uniref:TF-B3 domain-containing protein n=1 Tax=Nepenthes gracilis TaxID=150966 RepID=A0AAD3XMB8_NEPGR|nr:hypothetical protein Nepgr_011455 [Nepenthes gracilis]
MDFPSSSSSSSQCRGLLPVNNTRWEGSLMCESLYQQQRPPRERNSWQLFNNTNSDNLEPQEVGSSISKRISYPRDPQNAMIEPVDGSLEVVHQDNEAGDQELAAGGSSSGPASEIEREHMFDKVVTPSDVGKLNRLVIPKQHAEKYFPLDSSTNEKGLLLNFEDRSGKSWRFRYSYWNSSQSYVMTKGWSRFVKEKKLDAGDIVSFQRGVGEQGKDMFYIDWRRRPDAPPPPPLLPPHEPLLFPHHNYNFNLSLHHRSIPWSTPLLLRPQPPVPLLPMSVRDHAHTGHLSQMNMIGMIPQYPNTNTNHYHRNAVSYGGSSSGGAYGYGNYHLHYNQEHHVVNPPGSSSSVVYFRPAAPQGQQLRTDGGVAEPLVFQSVPVVQGKAAAKRLRLFGVNVDCPISQADDCDVLSCTPLNICTNSALRPYSQLSSSSSTSPNPHFQLRLYNGDPLPSKPHPDYLDDKGKSSSSSMSLDLDI